MSAPMSARTEAILAAVRHDGPTDPAAVVGQLDAAPPDERWSDLPPADRPGTVRRYLGRLVDAGELRRLEDGTYGAVWTTTTEEPPQQAETRTQEGPTMTSTPPDPIDDEPAATITTTEAGDAAATEQGHPLLPLLDDCLLGPWPPAVYDALEAVVRWDERRADLVRQRSDAQQSAQDAQAALSEAIVDGGDTGDLRAEIARHRDHADELDRAVDALDGRLRAARLAVLEAQEVVLTERAHTTRAATKTHRDHTADLVDQLAEHDGQQWRHISMHILGWGMQSRALTLDREAERLADVLLAVRATVADIPLGFGGITSRPVRRGPLATLAGVSSVPPLVDVEVETGEDAGSPEASQLVYELTTELTQTPVQ